ncbi:TPA: hypothetical protein ACM7GL_004609 [Escherichia coli]|nr:hypothetical protein [Citrobacter freundii]
MECIKIEQRGSVEIRTLRDEKGVFTKLYREKGKRLTRLTLEGNLIEQMKAFRSLEKDLRNLIAWSEILNDKNQAFTASENFFPDMQMADAAIAKGMYFAILALYGRCFTSAQNRRFTFDRKHVPEELREFHDELMHARHNFAAHKGAFEYEDCQIALIVAPHKKSSRTAIFSELQQPYFDSELVDEEGKNKFIELCNALRTVVNDKYKNLCDKIEHDFIRITPNEFWKNADGKVVNVDQYVKKGT